MPKPNRNSPLGPGQAVDRIAALRRVAADEAHAAAAAVLETLQKKEQAIRERVPADRLQSFDHMLKSIEPPPDPLTDGDEDVPGFGVDPGDSEALLELRQAIDEFLPWPNEQAQEKGEYLLAVMHAGNLLRAKPAEPTPEAPNRGKA